MEADLVVDAEGRHGLLEAAPDGPARPEGRVAIRLSSGERLDLPAELLERQDDGAYRLPFAFRSLRGDTFLEVEERLRVEKHLRETGRVRLTTRVESHVETVDEPLLRETVEVERVPIGRYVEAPADIRQEDDVTVVPVHEEVLVVEKRLLLKEEIRLVKRRTEAREPQDITLRRQQVEVERLPPNGTPVS